MTSSLQVFNVMENKVKVPILETIITVLFIMNPEQHTLNQPDCKMFV